MLFLTIIICLILFIYNYVLIKHRNNSLTVNYLLRNSICCYTTHFGRNVQLFTYPQTVNMVTFLVVVPSEDVYILLIENFDFSYNVFQYARLHSSPAESVN